MTRSPLLVVWPTAASPVRMSAPALLTQTWMAPKTSSVRATTGRVGATRHVGAHRHARLPARVISAATSRARVSERA